MLLLTIRLTDRRNSSARGAKAAGLQKSYASFGTQFEAVRIDDLATDQFPDVLKGIDAVVHAASPLPGQGTPEQIFKVS